MRGVRGVQAATALLVAAQRVVTVSAQSSTASGVQSCVKTSDLALSACPCDAATLTFAMEGETTVAANTVSICLWWTGERAPNPYAHSCIVCQMHPVRCAYGSNLE